MLKKLLPALKTIWLLIFWIPFSIILSIIIGITGFFGKKGILSFKFCQIWVWIAKTVCFTKFEYIFPPDFDKTKSYIIVSNHQSPLDIPALMLLGLPFRWILKNELKYVPFFGWGLFYARHIFVNRSKPKDAIKRIVKAAKTLPQGVSLAIFPEGTRSITGELKEFKVGAFIMATATKLPLLPITINGSHKVMPKKNSMDFYPGKIQIIVGDPIDTTQYSKKNVSELINHTKDTIASKLNLNYPD